MIIKNYYKKLKSSKLASRFCSGAFWSLGAGIFSSGGILLLGIILANLLGKEVYGQYGMIRSTLNLLVSISAFSLGTSASKYVAELRDRDKERTENIIVLSIVFIIILSSLVGVLCFIFADKISITFFDSRTLITPLKITAIMVSSSLVFGVFNGILIGFEDFKDICKINFLSAILLLLCSYIGATFYGLNGGLIGLLVYYVSQMILAMFALHFILKKNKLSLNWKNFTREIRTLWDFSLPISLSGFLVTPAIWYSNVLLIKNTGNFGDMAGYDVINQWKMALMFIPVVAGRIVLPMLSNLNGNNNEKAYKSVVKYNILLNVGITLAGALFLSLISRKILICYGENFVEYQIPFIIMIFSGGFYVANSIISQILLSKNFAWWNFLFNCIWCTTFCLLVFVTVAQKNMGLLGISFAFLGSYAIFLMSQLLFLCFAKIFKPKN